MLGGVHLEIRGAFHLRGVDLQLLIVIVWDLGWRDEMILFRSNQHSFFLRAIEATTNVSGSQWPMTFFFFCFWFYSDSGDTFRAGHFLTCCWVTDNDGDLRLSVTWRELCCRCHVHHKLDYECSEGFESKEGTFVDLLLGHRHWRVSAGSVITFCRCCDFFLQWCDGTTWIEKQGLIITCGMSRILCNCVCCGLL